MGAFPVFHQFRQSSCAVQGVGLDVVERLSSLKHIWSPDTHGSSFDSDLKFLQRYFSWAERLPGPRVPLPEMLMAGHNVPVEQPFAEGNLLMRTPRLIREYLAATIQDQHLRPVSESKFSHLALRDFVNPAHMDFRTGYIS